MRSASVVAATDDDGAAIAMPDPAMVSGKGPATEADFERVASDISCYNERPGPVFATLKGVARKLLRDDAGVRFLHGQNVKELRQSGGRFDAVETNDGEIAADAAVVCSGAWSGRHAYR